MLGNCTTETGNQKEQQPPEKHEYEKFKPLWNIQLETLGG